MLRCGWIVLVDRFSIRSVRVDNSIEKESVGMRRVVFFALLGVLISGYISLADAADPMIELEYMFPEPTLEMVDGEYHSVDMPETGKFYDTSGLPLLPVKTAKILMPQGRDVKAINVVPGKRIFLDGEFEIEYGTPAIPMGSNLAFAAMPDQQVYNSDKPFPGNLYSFVSTQFLCGYKILILNLYPVQYNPASGKIWYHENLKVIVAHAPDGPPGLQRAKCRGLRQDRARVKKLVDNPSQALLYSAEVTPMQEPWTYLVITNEAMAPIFQQHLADWKSSRTATHVETVEYIKSQFSGRDLQERIRNFIINAYNNHGTEYVVLGGDGDAGKGKNKSIIPCRGVYGKVVNTLTDQTWIDENIPCDMYYGALDGDWDNDADGIYGEGDSLADPPGTGDSGDEADFHAEVFVGRIPADDAAEALNQIGKIMAYETSSRPKKALLVGEKFSDDPMPDGTWGADYKDEVYSYFPVSWDEPTTMYEKDGLYTTFDLLVAMNSDEHHIVNYAGHSGYYIDMGLNNDEIGSLTNSVYFLAYSQGCNAGGFDQRFDDCIGEHFTVENGGGAAFAYIGNTRYGWYRKGTTNGPSQQFDKQMFHAFFNEGILSIGAALQDSKEDLIGFIGPTGAMRWCYFELCLLGDPETPFGATPLPPDIAPPAKVTDLAAGTPTSNSITLTWTAPDDDSGCPVMQYDIRYSLIDPGENPSDEWWKGATQCEWEPIPKPAGGEETFTATGLSADETYYFALKSVDGVSLWSGISNIATEDTTAGGDRMHVEAITPKPDPESLVRGKNVFWSVSATVLVHDQNRSMVENATVYGDWSGVYTATSVSAVTNADGKAVFTTDYVKGGGTFRFDVTSLVHDGLEHDPGADVQTYIEITAPSSASAPVTEYPTSLENAYPSMANPEVWIPFTLATPEHVVIRIFNMSGRLVRTLDLGQIAPGAYRSKEKAAYWDGRSESGESLASGIYFYTIQAGEFTATKKMAITR